ncbi:unnamed protein product, partial [Cyprideis torosa]
MESTRDPKEGTHFINSIIEAIQEHAFKHNLAQIFQQFLFCSFVADLLNGFHFGIRDGRVTPERKTFTTERGVESTSIVFFLFCSFVADLLNGFHFGIRDGRVTPERGIRDGRVTPEGGIRDGRVTPERGIRDGRVTPERGIRDGRVTPERKTFTTERGVEST